ncbi:GtrA family protein [Verticiella sediminum]|uniref:GtrA family protein n=1 Tax=Verticiella sediminum TaxID=1247510 RepID=A0A556ABI0_9BURK|nr:GtrA family protein [Verticiella sediminum]TSH90252.1 GtrA family protein [Verticiella sediminum]
MNAALPPPHDETRHGARRARRFELRRLWHEAWTAARFGVVGLSATALHLAVASGLITLFAVPPLAANTCAFLVAFCLSFSGNYFWTFRMPGDPRRAIKRFLTISFSAFLVNTLILSLLLESGRLAPVPSVVISVAVMPAITYLASRFWGFKPASPIRPAADDVRAGPADPRP